MRRLLCALLLLAPSLAWAQGAVQQSGPVTPSHIPVWVQDHLIGDGGPSPSSNPFCVNDGPTTGAYHQLCLNANSSGGGLISYTAMNGASLLPMNCSINGTLVANCLSGGGGGGLTPPINVTGPLTGPITADTGILNVTSANTAPTANQIYQYLVCGSACGAFTVDSMRGTMYATAGSTGWMQAISGYALNDNTSSNSTAVGAYAVGDIANSATYGIVSEITDHKYQVPSSGGQRYLYNGFDVNITNPTTVGAALAISGIFQAQPSSMNGIEIFAPNESISGGPAAPFNKWNYGVRVDNGAVSSGGVYLGTFNYTKTANDPSQSVNFNYVDGSGNYQYVTLYGSSASGGSVTLGGSNGYGILVPGGGGGVGLTLGPVNAASTPNGQSKSMFWQYWDAAGASQYFYALAQTNSLYFTSTQATSYVDVPNLVVAAGGGTIGANIGATAAGTPPSTASKSIQLNYIDGTSTNQVYAMQVTSAGALQISSGMANSLLVTPDLEIANGPGGWAGLTIGATASSGANVGSKSAIWDYFDNSGVSQYYVMQVSTNQWLSIGTSVGPGSAIVNIDGALYIRGTQGATCGGAPTASFSTINGVVTHC